MSSRKRVLLSFFMVVASNKVVLHHELVRQQKTSQEKLGHGLVHTNPWAVISAEREPLQSLSSDTLQLLNVRRILERAPVFPPRAPLEPHSERTIGMRVKT